MQIWYVIEAARQKKGSIGAIAAELGVSYPRVSEWKNGKYKPDATQLALLAEMAELDALEVLANIEYEGKKEQESVWSRIWRARRDSNPRPLPSEGPHRKNGAGVRTRGDAEQHPAGGLAQGARRFLSWLWTNVQADPALGRDPHQPSPAN